VKTLAAILTDTPLFGDLTRAQAELIAGCAGNVHFQPGQVIFREGAQADTFYLVRHGRIQLDMYIAGRGSVAIDTVDPGDLVGWSWLFPPYRWHFDATALTSVRATAFDGACLRAKCVADPALGYPLTSRFAQLIIERLQASQHRLIHQDQTPSPSRRPRW
jgi:CRP-like cAMP-binding protein